MTVEDESNHDLIIVGAGLLAGLLVSVAIKILSDAYSGIKVVTPESMSLVEPVSLVYVIGIFLGIYWFLMESWKNFGRFGKLISFIAGFLITVGLSMIGAVL